MTLSTLNSFTSTLKPNGTKMPVLFIGHGSPMNGIEETVYSASWKKMAANMPTPAAVIVVSAHWLTRGTRITAVDFPETIHDFGGFPKELFDVQYPAPGSPIIARETAELIRSTNVELAHDWGLDHGAWTVIRHMYPLANIPILQLSIDYHKSARYHYELAGELAALRKKGVLIIGSGNMIHNLRMAAWDKMNDEFGFEWAHEMNDYFKSKILSGDHNGLINYTKAGTAASYAVPTPDHYYPLLYTLGLQEKDEEILLFNDTLLAGSLSMTSVKIG